MIERDVRSDIGGDEQTIENLATDYSEITFKHLLLPVYAGAYRYNGKLFQILVNGRTGEIQGDRPYSFWKIALLVLSLVIVVLILVMVLGERISLTRLARVTMKCLVFLIISVVLLSQTAFALASLTEVKNVSTKEKAERKSRSRTHSKRTAIAGPFAAGLIGHRCA